jgi:hypothetical protein
MPASERDNESSGGQLQKGETPMLTYMTLEREVFDLSELPPDERAFLDRCIAAYRDGMEWVTFARLTEGLENPLLRPTGGLVTLAVLEHPLYTVTRDLATRLGIRQGYFRPRPEDAFERDPLADEWLSVEEAARRKGVTVAGLRRGIVAGRVIAHPAPGDDDGRLLVSANSLARWAPRTRRAAGADKQPAGQRA